MMNKKSTDKIVTGKIVTGSDLASPDYRALLRSLPADEKRRLMTLTNHHGLIWLVAHLGLIGGMMWVNNTYDGVIGGLGLIGQGIGLCFLFCAMHEAGHGTAFRSKPLNTFVTSLAGFILFLGPIWFRSFHAAHHRHTHDAGLDPELVTPKPRTWGEYLFHLSGIMIWISGIRTMLSNAFRMPADAFIPSSSQRQVMAEARLMLAFYAVVLGGGLWLAPQAILQFWLLPIMVGQPFLRMFLLAEHAGCPHDPDMLKNSRTTRTNPLVLFLSWNMPYHTAHHSFPAVPFHQLPAFHRHIAGHVAVTANSYPDFHHGYARDLQKS